MERKNMFSINLDDERVIDNEELILRRESSQLAETREQLSADLTDALKKNMKKTFWRILPPYIVAGIGVLLGTIAFELAEAKEKFPIALSVIAGILIVAGIVWAGISNKKAKDKEDEPDENLEHLDKDYEAFNSQVKRELNIPENAPEVEFFSHVYSSDDKKKKLVYSNDTANVFVEGDTLCFWYGGAVIGLPMNEIEALVKVNAPITFDSWMSDDPHDSLKYAQYDIEKKETNYEEHYTMKGYYSLRFAHGDTPLELLFPLFNADALLKLLDREIIEE